MSTLSVGTIKSISSAAPVFQNTSGTEKGQLVKAWCNFDQTDHSIRGSFNVSSLTDLAVGQTEVNYTNAMSNTNYCGVIYNNARSLAILVNNFQNDYIGGMVLYTNKMAVSAYGSSSPAFQDSKIYTVLAIGDN